MITYRFEEELKFAVYYAQKFEDERLLEILEQGEVKNAGDAILLSEFFWKMVDASIEDEKQNVELPWTESGEFWNEKLLNSLSGYLERAGYEKEWDEVLDKQ